MLLKIWAQTCCWRIELARKITLPISWRGIVSSILAKQSDWTLQYFWRILNVSSILVLQLVTHESWAILFFPYSVFSLHISDDTTFIVSTMCCLYVANPLCTCNCYGNVHPIIRCHLLLSVHPQENNSTGNSEGFASKFAWNLN